VAELLSPGIACANALVVAASVELDDEEVEDVAELDASFDSSAESNWLAAPAATDAIMTISRRIRIAVRARILPASRS
jgi:hypothetical protein